MDEFFNDPVAVGMGIFGLLLLVGSGFNKLQKSWEQKQQRQRQHDDH